MTVKSAVDNEMYRTKGHVWWNENENVATLRFFVNPVRFEYFLVIKFLQDWQFFAQHEPRSHAWNHFIRQDELHEAMAKNGLVSLENRGISTRGNVLSHLLNLRRRVNGKITFREFGERMRFHESGDTSVSYMGYALKRNGALEGQRP